MIVYKDNLNGITPDMLEGFCIGWSKPLNGNDLYRVLFNSYKFVLAVENEKIIGFVNAISDKVRFAFIPMLEVLPKYKGKKIGTELMKSLLVQLEEIKNIDLICDKDVQPFYEKLGMIKYTGMVIRK